MSRGSDRRTADLENLEAEFGEALAQARLERWSAYLAEKLAQPRRSGATQLDVKLFTLESKIARIRERLGLPAFVPVAPPPKAPAPAPSWPEPPEVEGSRFALDPRFLRRHLQDTGVDPDQLFSKVKCAGPRQRQSPGVFVWRLVSAECGQDRIPARLQLTVMPLPEGADADDAAEKLHESLGRLIQWCVRASQTPPRERPRLLTLSYDRKSRETQFSAR